MKVNKQELKDTINKIVNNLVDTVEIAGNINFFEINIKRINKDLNVELVNKYKEKIG